MVSDILHLAPEQIPVLDSSKVELKQWLNTLEAAIPYENKRMEVLPKLMVEPLMRDWLARLSRSPEVNFIRHLMWRS